MDEKVVVAEAVKAPTIDRLEKLGFKAAAVKNKETKVRARKMMIAYEHYRYVRQEKIDAFNKKLLSQGTHYEYKTLAFTPVEKYSETPPDSVLDAMQVAVERNCFDAFEVAHIVNVKDPILFGRVSGCPDRFYIGQWDLDVCIEDILKENEG